MTIYAGTKPNRGNNINLKIKEMKTNVKNMISSKGNTVSNQFIITTAKGVFFQSYNSIIAFIPKSGKIQLDKNYWDYSKTTGKYRNDFLSESKKETQQKIDSKEYLLKDLNK